MPESALCRPRHNAECADLGLCRRRSWTPRRSGARGRRGRHNPIGGNAGARNRTEETHGWPEGGTSSVPEAFASSRRRGSVAASKSCASNGAEAQDSSSGAVDRIVPRSRVGISRCARDAVSRSAQSQGRHNRRSRRARARQRRARASPSDSTVTLPLIFVFEPHI
jgi:hypothetical protein